MKARVLKKILKNRNHPRHREFALRVTDKLEAYGRAECVRIGIDSDQWNTAALRWPARLTRPLRFIRS